MERIKRIENFILHNVGYVNNIFIAFIIPFVFCIILVVVGLISFPQKTTRMLGLAAVRMLSSISGLQINPEKVKIDYLEHIGILTIELQNINVSFRHAKQAQDTQYFIKKAVLHISLLDILTLNWARFYRILKKSKTGQKKRFLLIKLSSYHYFLVILVILKRTD